MSWSFSDPWMGIPSRQFDSAWKTTFQILAIFVSQPIPTKPMLCRFVNWNDKSKFCKIRKQTLLTNFICSESRYDVDNSGSIDKSEMLRKGSVTWDLTRGSISVRWYQPHFSRPDPWHQSQGWKPVKWHQCAKWHQSHGSAPVTWYQLHGNIPDQWHQSHDRILTKWY